MPTIKGSSDNCWTCSCGAINSRNRTECQRCPRNINSEESEDNELLSSIAGKLDQARAKKFGALRSTNIFPQGDEHWYVWEVLLFQDKESMKKAVRSKISPYQHGEDEGYGAIVCPLTRVSYEKDQNGIESPSLGYACFYLENTGMEVIAHEALHMAMGYLRRKSEETRDKGYTSLIFEDEQSGEEHLAYPTGWCAMKLYDFLHPIRDINSLPS